MGGKFQDGFLSAAAAKGATFLPGVGDYLRPSEGHGNILTRTALAATIGGTASALGGGKFANGAKTAAMQHLFNEELTGAINKVRAKAINQKIQAELAPFMALAASNKAKGLATEISDETLQRLLLLSHTNHIIRGSWDLRGQDFSQYKNSLGTADNRYLFNVAGYQFTRGGLTFSNSDVNYIDVGMVMRVNGYSRNAIINMVTAWNVGEAIAGDDGARNFQSGRGFSTSNAGRQLNQIVPGATWALIGADYVEWLNERR